MKKQRLWVDPRALAMAGLLASSLAAPAADADLSKSSSCLTGSPARPAPTALWPELLCPADPGTDSACVADPSVPLPAARDSTTFAGSQTPARGLEFFVDLDVVEDDTLDPPQTHLYMAYNSGWQIWDITGENAKDPLFLSGPDGFFGDFFAWEALFTHNWQLIWDIDAIVPANPVAPGETLVAVAGRSPVGLSIWDATDKENPELLYQDATRFGIQVAAANIDGKSYAFFATPGGVHVYDMTRARGLSCLEGSAACAGVYRGVLDQDDCLPSQAGLNRCAQFVDVLETQVGADTRHYVSFSDGHITSALGLEIREITDPATAASTKVVDGLALSATQGLVFGNDLFEYDGRYYVAAVNVTDLQIYDVTPCITGGPSAPGCGFGNLRASHATTLAEKGFVKYSQAGGLPFVYKGQHVACSEPPVFGGPAPEFLLDLRNIAADELPAAERAKPIVGAAIPDPVTGRRIDYWSSYYDKATNGYSAFSPINGMFHGEYFYRAAQTVFDVHRWRGAVAPSVKISATSADRWLSTTEPQLDEWVQLGIECLPSGVDSNWMWSAENLTGEISDPQPMLDGNILQSPRVLAQLCASDTYPAEPCPGRTIEVQATADCDSSTLAATPLPLTLGDPRPFVSGVETDEALSGTPPYSVCQTLTFRTSEAFAGKSAGRTYEWRIAPLASGGVERICPGDPELTCSETSLTWATKAIDLGVIFTDGFESGDVSAWGGSKSLPKATATHEVTLSLSSPYLPAAEPFERTTQVTLEPLAALALSPGFFSLAGPDVAGSYDFTALAQGATAFHWEFEQAPGLAGNDPVCIGGDTVPCCRLMADCQVRETVIGQVNYAWPPVGNASGLHQVGLEVGNCVGGAPAAGSRAVDVVVSDAVAPEIDNFFLVTDANCGCTGFFGAECHCNLTGSSVTASVTLDISGICSSLDLDWGDGNVDTGLACDAASYAHPYTAIGSYELKATACLGALCDTQVRFTNPPVLLDIE